MAIPKSHASYRDVEAVLDTLVRMDQWPAEVRCESHKAAVQWRARASHFRAYLRNLEEARLGLQPGLGTSPYDNLIMTLTPASSVVTVKPREVGVVLSVAGQEVTPIADRDLEAPESPPHQSGPLGLEVEE